MKTLIVLKSSCYIIFMISRNAMLNEWPWFQKVTVSYSLNKFVLSCLTFKLFLMTCYIQFYLPCVIMGSAHPAFFCQLSVSCVWSGKTFYYIADSKILPVGLLPSNEWAQLTLFREKHFSYYNKLHMLTCLYFF